jgi:hypothetical protein
VSEAQNLTQGRGEEDELNQKEGRGATRERQIPKLVENINMTECTQEIAYFQSINSDKHLPQSPFIGQFF